MIDPALLSDRVIVKNPFYGEPIGEWGSRSVKPERFLINKLEKESRFFSKLEASIESEGFRNPIFCNAYDHGTYARYGTCRLWIAKKKQLHVPAIIADYSGKWKHLEELHGEADIREKYKDQPSVVEIGGDEMRIDACPHYHLGEV